jgi:hypothetical protein
VCFSFFIFPKPLPVLKTRVEDFSKNEFLLKLEHVFEDLKTHGDTFLNAIEGRCGQCSKDKTGFLFFGNNSRRYMNLLFDRSNGEIKDLYECSSFRTSFDSDNFTERLFIDYFKSGFSN